MTTVLAISGSLRKASHNTGLLRAIAENAPEGVNVDIFEGLDRLPAYNQDHEQDPGAEVEALRAAIKRADAVLIATPEYNGSTPGHVKTAVDWASRPRGSEASLHGKPVAVLSTSMGQYGGTWAAEALRKTLTLAGANVAETVNLAIAASHEKFEADGNLVDAEIAAELNGVLSELLAHISTVTAAA